jgi:hypothetical protein
MLVVKWSSSLALNCQRLAEFESKNSQDPPVFRDTVVDTVMNRKEAEENTRLGETHIQP